MRKPEGTEGSAVCLWSPPPIWILVQRSPLPPDAIWCQAKRLHHNESLAQRGTALMFSAEAHRKRTAFYLHRCSRPPVFNSHLSGKQRLILVCQNRKLFRLLSGWQ